MKPDTIPIEIGHLIFRLIIKSDKGEIAALGNQRDGNLYPSRSIKREV